MPDTYELTQSQRETWRARIASFFLPENNCTRLAQRGGFGKNEGTAAGYIGQLRDGHPRALRYFFGEPARLQKLATAFGIHPATIEALFQEVKRGTSGGTEAIFLPGFEDWGLVPFEDGFVVPRVTPAGQLSVAPFGRLRDRTIEITGLRATFLREVERHVRISAPAGSGITTLLRALARWAAEDGWRVSWGAGSGLPSGRAELLVLDGLDHPLPPDLATWAKAPGHALLLGCDATRSRALAAAGTLAIARTSWALTPVDTDWAERLLQLVRPLAPPTDRRRLAAVERSHLTKILSTLARATPELVGVLLREVMEGRDIDLPGRGITLVAETARRRLRGNRTHPEEAPLRGVDSWLGSAYTRSLEAPDRPLHEGTESALLARAHAVIDEVQATAEQRDVLRSVLPAASAAGVLEALVAADILRDQPHGSERWRLEPLLAAGVAMDVAQAGPILRLALVQRRDALLSAVVRAPGGPEALARALADLSGPALATALDDATWASDWLSRVRWDSGLVARVVAMTIATGTLDGALPRKRRRTAGGVVEPELWVHLAQSGEVPTVGGIQAALAGMTDELGVPPLEVSDLVVRMLLALLSPAAANLTDPALWEALPPALFPYPPWVERLAETVDGLLFLTDASQSPVAERVLHAEIEEPGDKASVTEPPPHRAWIPLVERLAERDGPAVAGVLARMFRTATEVNLAQRGKPIDRREIATLAPTWQTDWTRRVDGLLSGVAVALQNPGIRRRHSLVRGALRAELPAWQALAEAEDVPIGPWAEGGYWLSYRALDATASLFAFLLTPAERVAAIRMPGGILSPFWPALLEAGVPIIDAVQLLQDIEAGRIVGVPGRGAPSTREMANHRLHADLGPVPSTSARVLEALIKRTSPEDLPRLPGFADPASGGMPDPALIASCVGRGAGIPSVRRHLWGFVRTLDADSIIWPLLDGGKPDSPPFERVRPFLQGSALGSRGVTDRDAIATTLHLVSASTLTIPQWERLTNAALLAGVPGAALIPLLAEPVAREARPTLVVELVRAVQGGAPDDASRWLIDRLQDSPALVDREPFIDVWVTSTATNEVLLAYIDASNQGAPRGEGVLPALVRRGVERLAAWLGHESTRDAAFSALTLLPDWPARLGEALRASERPLAPSVLAQLLRRDLGLEVLDDASARWPATRQRELWHTALSVTTDSRKRWELWRRLTKAGA